MLASTNPPVASGSQRKRAIWKSWLIWLSIAGVSSIAIIAAGVLWSQRQAAIKLNQEVRRVADSGQPVDNQSLGRWFRERTHTEGTRLWGDIISAIHGNMLGYPDFDDLPIQGRGELPEQLVPGGQWPEEPIVAEYLEYTGPIIDMIDQASQFPTPVWRPIEFEGISTLLPELQSSRSISRLLQLDAEHALYHRDTERAMRAIRLMGTTATAFDWDFCLVATLVHHALYGIQLGTIQRSMNADLWNSQQLEELLEIVQAPRNVDQRFRDTFAGERAMLTAITADDVHSFESNFGGLFFLIYQMPSTRIKLWETYARIQELADRDLKVMWAKVGRFHDELEIELRQRPFDPGNILTGLLLPAGQAFNEALIWAEDSRRLTRSALAVKKFQQQYDRWPSRLAELEKVGLTRQDWNSVFSGPFGFEIIDEQAVMWTTNIVSGPDSQIPTQFSEVDEDERHRFQVVRIR